MRLVSVVIPSYNHAPYIRQAVESVLAQTHVDLELIVIDDGSTDTSVDYLRTVRDPRFTLIEQANAGAHNAINKGLALAKGKYLAILNSDDAFHPKRLETCVSTLEKGEVELVATWIEVINQKGKVLGVKEGWRNMLPWTINQSKPDLPGVNEFTQNLLMTNFVSTTSNIVFTRKVYEQIGGMRNLRFVHDWDFLLRVALKFKCELIEIPLIQYRTHQSNTISSNRAWMLFEICWIFSVHLKRFSADIFRRPYDAAGLSKEIDFLANSINLQGNEKVMWLLLQYLAENEKAGIDSPEENLIEEEQMRNVFIRHIVI
jgi:glycosyltransferase involved in cell wall biosynthesis